MASKNQVRLEAVAEVQKARAEILKLVDVVNQLAASLGKTADKKFTVTTGESLKKLDEMEKKLASLENAVAKSATAVEKESAKSAAAIEKARDREIKAVEKAVASAAKEITAIEKAVGAKERAASRQARAAENEAAAAERATNKIIASENKKSAAQDRASNQQALNIAKKVANEEKEAAAAQRTAERVAAAEAKKAAAIQAANAKLAAKKAALEQAQAAEDKFSASVLNATRALQAFFASVVLGKIKDFIVDVVETQAAMEGYTNAMAAAVGGTKEANEEIERLRGVANTFGLSFETLVQKFGRFRIAASSTSLTLEQTRAVFDGFAIANRALGNSAESTARVFAAIEQSMSKGVIQSEELKQQLGDSLPGAYTKLATAIGVTTGELEKMLKENRILSEEALPALAAELLRTLGPAVVKNAGSTRAEIERLKNAIFDAKVAIGEGAKPELLEFLRLLRQIGTDGSDNINRLGSAIGGILDRLSDVIKIVDNLSSGRIFNALGNVINILIENMDRLVRTWLLFAISVKESIGEISKAEADAQRKFLSGWQSPLGEIADGFDELAKVGKSSAEEIAIAANVEGKKQVEAYKATLKANEETYAAFVEKAKNAAQALTKEEAKELKKREQAFEAFFAKIGDLALKQPKVNLPDAPGPVNIGSPSGDFVSDDQILKITAADTKLQKLKETLAELIAKKYELENDPYVTGGQIQAVQELEEKILKTEQAIRKTSETAAASLLAEELEKQEKASAKLAAQMDAYSASVKAALVDLVRDNDAFRDSFTRLDEGSQIAVESLIGNLERAAAAGTATEADFQNFLSGIAAIFGQAGVIGQEFAVGLQASFGQGQASVVGLLQSLAAIGPTALAGAEGMSAATATVVANADEQKIAVQSVGTVSAEAFLAASDAAKASSDEITASFEGAADNAAKAQVRMVDAVARGAGDSVAAITNTIDFASGKVDDFGGLVETIGEKGERSFTMVGDAAKAAGDEVANTINVATDATGKLTVSNEKIEQAGDAAVAAFKEATKEVGAAVGEIGKVDTATKGAKTSSEGLAKAAASTKKSAEDTPAAIDKVSASVALLDGKLAGVEAKLQSCLTICLQLEQCMNRIAQ